MTSRTISEIELAIAKYFDIRKNIIIPNISWGFLNHEADLLIMSNSGYLTEIEIKRTWSDFLADFKKEHKHNSKGVIRYFYYCVPENMLSKVREKLLELNIEYTGILTYDEELHIKRHGYEYIDHNNYIGYCYRQINPSRKLFIEEQLQLLRLSNMMVWNLKQKLVDINTLK